LPDVGYDAPKRGAHFSMAIKRYVLRCTAFIFQKM